MNEYKIIRIFLVVSDFCDDFEPWFNQFLLDCNCKKRIRNCRLSLSEIMTILIFFQMSGYRNFKKFYCDVIFPNKQNYFSQPVSYNRFVELKPTALLALCVFLNKNYGKVTGISYIDSTSLIVCKKSRARRHKRFASISGWGKSSVDWFFGLKLHLVVNEKGEILNCKITRANTDYRFVLEEICSSLFGKLFGDRGYIPVVFYFATRKQGNESKEPRILGD